MTDVERLKNTLEDCRNLLISVGEKHWSYKIEVLLKQPKWGYHTMENIISWYGTMGSFNDLYICKSNGFTNEKTSYDSANNRLEILRQEIGKLAQKILKSST